MITMVAMLPIWDCGLNQSHSLGTLNKVARHPLYRDLAQL